MFRNIEVEEEVKFVQKVAGVVRSTRADYNLPNKTKTELYLQVFCQKSAQVEKKLLGCKNIWCVLKRVIISKISAIFSHSPPPPLSL